MKKLGGSVYIRYTNNTPENNKTFKVRVSGGESIPMLDLHEFNPKTNTAEDISKIKLMIEEYISELNKHVSELPEGARTSQVLNSTEIVLPNVLISIPADRALAGLGDRGVQANRLYNTYRAWEEMMGLFYKEKGLDGTSATSALPRSRINVRYMKMFYGAFMYASGEHIGIEYGSCSGMTSGTPLMNEDGKVNPNFGGYFGWGISHEIGHVIDQAGYASAETTNNIYSLFAQTANDTNKSRLELSNKYSKIYQKVTSHTEGVPGDVFTHLGMYWQLHLAYDNENTASSSNTFYSRLHTYYRENELRDLGKNDKLICYASRAANKDLTAFFDAWGTKVADKAKVQEYMDKYNLEPETRSIYYLNDNARRYRLNKGEGLEGQNVTVTASFENSIDDINKNKQVKLSFSANANSKDILGYEILRNGESVGFTALTDASNSTPKTTDATFIDNLNAINNRVLKYEVVVYDQIGNKVGSTVLDSFKVQNDGKLNGANFNVVSNVINSSDKVYEENEDNFENTDTVGTIKNVIDGDKQTVFIGNKLGDIDAKLAGASSSVNEKPYITIELNDIFPVYGIRYTKAVDGGANWENDYKIEVSTDNQNWREVKSGEMTDKQKVGEDIIYFGNTEGELLSATCGYVKIIANGMNVNANTNTPVISAAEIELLSPSGDNIDFNTEKQDGVYHLKEKFVYEEIEQDEEGNTDAKTQEIPAGYVVIKSTFSGYPLYNVALLKARDEKSDIYVYSSDSSTTYEEIFLANVPENGDVLTTVYDGTCLIFMSKEEYEKILEGNTKTYGKIELFRVDDALSLDGQRLVSDTLDLLLPEYSQLPLMKLEGDGSNQQIEKIPAGDNE